MLVNLRMHSMNAQADEPSTDVGAVHSNSLARRSTISVMMLKQKSIFTFRISNNSRHIGYTVGNITQIKKNIKTQGNLLRPVKDFSLGGMNLKIHPPTIPIKHLQILMLPRSLLNTLKNTDAHIRSSP